MGRLPLLVAGTRTLVCPSPLLVIDHGVQLLGCTPTEVVSGTAGGPDRWGIDWATRRRLPVVRFPAAWWDLDAPGARVARDKSGRPFNKAAGVARNTRMAEYLAEHQGAALILWDGVSAGTGHMVQELRRLKIRAAILTLRWAQENT